MDMMKDTICAPATALGTGAIGIIRVSGPDALAIADKVITLRRGRVSECPGYSLRYGGICGVDEGMVAIFRAPHSYTGEDSVELYCHASSFIMTRVLETLMGAGCRMAGPGEYTRRAFVNGRMDLAQAEAVADVIAASSEAAHRVAMNQLKGGYSSELKGLRDQLLELSVLLELELDFSEEEVEFAQRSQLQALLDTALGHVIRLAESFRTGNAIRHGVPVAIVGAVNAGKSTLLNALLGEDRAIVSDIPGTTRDTVEDVVTLDGVQFRFIDTAGIRETGDVIEQMGIQRSREAMAKADVVLAVVDASAPDARTQAEEMASQVRGDQTLIIVINKVDVAAQDGIGNSCAALDKLQTVRVSAMQGEGMDELRAMLARSQADRMGAAESTIVTSLRHYEALCAARENLQAVRSGLEHGIPTDLLASDLRLAISSLGTIWGEGLITPQETLNAIFSRHCIGK